MKEETNNYLPQKGRQASYCPNRNKKQNHELKEVKNKKMSLDTHQLNTLMASINYQLLPLYTAITSH